MARGPDAFFYGFTGTNDQSDHAYYLSYFIKHSKTHAIACYCHMFPVFPVSLPRLLTEAEKSLGIAKMAVKLM